MLLRIQVYEVAKIRHNQGKNCSNIAVLGVDIRFVEDFPISCQQVLPRGLNAMRRNSKRVGTIA